MLKKDIVKRVSNNLGFERDEIGFVFDEIFKVMKETVASGEEISIRNFGRFVIKETKPRIGNNVYTGKKVIIPKRQRVRFIPGKFIKEELKKEL